MRLLIHGLAGAADGITAISTAITRHGHHGHSIQELGLEATAGVSEIFAAIERRQWGLITSDRAIVQFLYDNHQHFNDVIILLAANVSADDYTAAIDRLFERYPRLTRGRLYTLTNARVKIRQLPAISR